MSRGVTYTIASDGIRSVETVASAIIGIAGTAPAATTFGVNEPKLCFSRDDLAGIGNTGTLPAALDAIFDQQVGQNVPVVIVIRVDEGVDNAATISNLIGSVDGNGNASGMQIFAKCQDLLGSTPRIFIAPGYSNEAAVAAELKQVANALSGITYLDGGNTTDAAAITFKDTVADKRVIITDPSVQVFDVDSESYVIQPASARQAGLRAVTDMREGYWVSESNKQLLGVTGIGRDNSNANNLTDNAITTVIQRDGFRIWGARTTSADPLWVYTPVVRTFDMALLSLQKAYLSFIDKPLNNQTISDIVETGNRYLAQLKGQGAIRGFELSVPVIRNTEQDKAKGELNLQLMLAPTYVLETITIRASIDSAGITIEN